MPPSSAVPHSHSGMCYFPEVVSTVVTALATFAGLTTSLGPSFTTCTLLESRPVDITQKAPAFKSETESTRIHPSCRAQAPASRCLNRQHTPRWQTPAKSPASGMVQRSHAGVPRGREHMSGIPDLPFE